MNNLLKKLYISIARTRYHVPGELVILRNAEVTPATEGNGIKGAWVRAYIFIPARSREFD